jgi:hypothetical protein
MREAVIRDLRILGLDEPTAEKIADYILDLLASVKP